jgi:hypothetical protein
MSSRCIAAARRPQKNAHVSLCTRSLASSSWRQRQMGSTVASSRSTAIQRTPALDCRASTHWDFWPRRQQGIRSCSDHLRASEFCSLTRRGGIVVGVGRRPREIKVGRAFTRRLRPAPDCRADEFETQGRGHRRPILLSIAAILDGCRPDVDVYRVISQRA